MLAGPVTRSTGRQPPSWSGRGSRRRTSRPRRRLRRRTPRRCRAGRRRRGSRGAAGRRAHAAPDWRGPVSGRRRPERGRRSSGPTRPAAPWPRGRTGRPGRPATLRWVTLSARATVVVTSSGSSASEVRRRRRRLLEARPQVRVEAARAAVTAAGGTRTEVISTPSNRAAWRTSSACPCRRTASHNGRTCSTAASTSNSARGTRDR